MPKNKGLIFHMGEVSELWCKTMVYMFYARVEASVPEPEIEKANVQARVPEQNPRVFNLSNCSVVIKML